MCDPNMVGTGGALGSPKGGDQKPIPRSQLYAMKRCCECTLIRVVDDGDMCPECRANIASYCARKP